MEQRVTLTVNGQEVNQSDFNTVAKEAAFAVDFVLAELLRPAPTGAGDSYAPSKYIVPAGGPKGIGYSAFNRRPVVSTSAAADAKIHIQPFTAVIGSRESSGPQEALQEIRVARHYGVIANNFVTHITIPPATQSRFDLIYAIVAVDQSDAAVDRYVKTGSGPGTSQSIVVTKKTTVTIGRISGTENNASPGRPALPADAGGVFHIALAYVFVEASFGPTTQVSGNWIHELYKTVPISAAYGAMTMAPCNSLYEMGYASQVNEQWTNIERAKTHQPSGKVGGFMRTLAVHAIDSGSGSPSCPANQSTLVDDSVDWRKREFVIFMSTLNAQNDGFPWTVTPPSSGNAAWSTDRGMGLAAGPATSGHTIQLANSYLDNASNLTAAALANGCVLAWFTDATQLALAAGAKLALYVNPSNGSLYVWRNNVNAVRYLMFWIMATAPHRNSDFNGS